MRRVLETEQQSLFRNFPGTAVYRPWNIGFLRVRFSSARKMAGSRTRLFSNDGRCIGGKHRSWTFSTTSEVWATPPMKK